MCVASVFLAIVSLAYATTDHRVSRIPAEGTVVPDSYAVILKGHVSAANHLSWVQGLQVSGRKSELRRDIKPHSVVSTFDLGPRFRGYDVTADENVIDLIRQHPDVDFIEQHQYVYALEQNPEPSDQPLYQYDAPWGLGRVSHRGHENTSWPYVFSEQGLGRGVDVYVLDSGVLAEHEEFEGRVVEGKSFLPGEDTTTDTYYHGTHCAGTIAGKTFGVAKSATIVPVKVLNSDGVASSLFLRQGMQWALERHNATINNRDRRKTFRGSVVNMSMGLNKGRLINNLVEIMVNAGMHVVAAAGNENTDACTKSPASSPFAITVGAVDSDDRFATLFSNWGSCVDINGPGVDIRSAGIANTTAEFVATGTSMAAPHVAGIVASLLSRMSGHDVGTDGEGVPVLITPKRLKEHLLEIASKGLISNHSLRVDTPNAIAYNGGARSGYINIIGRNS